MMNLQVLLREHKLAYTFIFLKKILSDTLWELSVQSIRLILYQTDTHPQDMPNADPVRHQMSELHHREGMVWGYWWIKT